MKFHALTQINTGNAIYQEGETLDLDPDTAAPLLALEAIEPVCKPFAAPLNPLLKEKS